MSKTKIIFSVVGVFVGSLAILFVLELVGLGLFKFFEPKRENIKREIFENTQSCTHGKIQDLAKYYEEYSKANSENSKETIRQLIIIRFAEFDGAKITSPKLKNFLATMRGY